MQYPLRGIVVCVNYDDLLSITLLRNARHLTSVLVVTSPESYEATWQVVRAVPNAQCYVTDAFTRYGAAFNKGLAIEEGFDVLGRDGWILAFDADTLFPDVMPLPELQIGKLYSPRRRMLLDPKHWSPSFDWNRVKHSNDRAFAGYYQLFHASDPHIQEQPWYDVTFQHAGGCDGYFQSRWPKYHKIRPNFDVLHLGPRDTNWFGRASARLDDLAVNSEAAEAMRAFMISKGWRRGARREGFTERVQVPGHEPRKWDYSC